MTFPSGKPARGRVGGGREPCSPLSPLMGISFKKRGGKRDYRRLSQNPFTPLLLAST